MKLISSLFIFTIFIYNVSLSDNETDFLNRLSEKGIQIIGMGSNKLRMVTHLNYSDAMHERLLQILVSI